MTVTQRIREFNEDRGQEFCKWKFNGMKEGAFFFRGSCHLFYEDFSKNIPMEDRTVTSIYLAYMNCLVGQILVLTPKTWPRIL